MKMVLRDNLMRKFVKYPLADVIYQIIFNNLNFVDQHKFRNMCTYFQKFQIVRLMNNDDDKYELDKFKHADFFDREILDKYIYAISLRINLYDEIFNIEHMTNLRRLYFWYDGNNHDENLNVEDLSYVQC